MKNTLLNALLAGFLLLGIFSSSCSKVDLENEINDSEGITVDLAWSNGNPNPTIGTRFNLYLYNQNNFNYILSSTNYNDFQSFDVPTSGIADGDYDVKVYISEINKLTDYTLTFTGIKTGKTYKLNYSGVLISDKNTTITPVTIKKSGNSFTINQ